jgi:hypothetical protein
MMPLHHRRWFRRVVHRAPMTIAIGPVMAGSIAARQLGVHTWWLTIGIVAGFATAEWARYVSRVDTEIVKDRVAEILENVLSGGPL